MRNSSVEKVAVEYFREGFNCSEAIMRAFSEIYDLNYNLDLLKAATVLGGGIGGAKDLCGSLSGAALVIGTFEGREDTSKDLRESYALSKELYKRFNEEYPEVSCIKLTKDVEWGSKGHFELCEVLIEKAVKVADDILKENNRL